MGSSKSIKIFKRKDIEGSIHHTSEPQSAPVENESKTERRSRRELVNTVSGWVSERRETNRREEIESLRRFFGDTSIMTGA